MAINEINGYAPIVLFTYNRLDHTKQTIEKLKNNYGAKQSNLYIISDGFKNHEDKEAVEQVRNYIDTTTGFKNIKIIKRKNNYGLGRNIISGISHILKNYESVIVLEDDIITSKFFLTYMNLALQKYKSEPKVMSISGYISPIKKEGLDDYFFMPWFECWGWATWKDRWAYFERTPKRLITNSEYSLIKRVNVNGSAPDLWNQVIDNYKNIKYTWAIFNHISICKNEGLVLYPKYSLCKNIGFDGSGDNCDRSNDYDTTIDEKKRSYSFPNEYMSSKLAIKRFEEFNNKRNKGIRNQIVLRSRIFVYYLYGKVFNYIHNSHWR